MTFRPSPAMTQCLNIWIIFDIRNHVLCPSVNFLVMTPVLVCVIVIDFGDDIL